MKKIIVCCMLVAINLVGCRSEYVYNREAEFSSRFIRTNPDSGRDPETLGYLIDLETGVVYLEYDGHYSHAITVMLNPDGTPVTKEQLELEV